MNYPVLDRMMKHIYREHFNVFSSTSVLIISFIFVPFSSLTSWFWASWIAPKSWLEGSSLESLTLLRSGRLYLTFDMKRLSATL